MTTTFAEFIIKRVYVGLSSANDIEEELTPLIHRFYTRICIMVEIGEESLDIGRPRYAEGVLCAKK